MPRELPEEVRDVFAASRRWAVVCAPVLDVLALLPGGCFDLIEGDPPYGTGEWKRPAAGAGRDCRAVHHKADWDVWDPAWVPEALRVARGPAIVYGPQTRLEELLALGRAHDVATRTLLWVKPDPKPRFAGQPSYGFEPAVAFRSNLLRGSEPDWTMASATRLGRDRHATGHPHEKPLAVARKHVRLGSPPGGAVLALFAGSGTTGEAALCEGRRVVLVERDPEWCARIAARLTAWEAGASPSSRTLPLLT